MNKSVFNQLGGGMQNGNFMQQLKNFMSKNQGIDPNAEINRMLQSGQVTQQQYNQANQMAQNLMRTMFGIHNK